MIRLNSSFIAAAGYDGSTLSVLFHNGRTYDHPGVPYSVFLGLINATSSHGRFYNQYIRGKYK